MLHEVEKVTFEELLQEKSKEDETERPLISALKAEHD
jgi:hypothetical protein